MCYKLTIETMFHSLSDSQDFAIPVIALEVLVPGGGRSTICPFINSLIKEVDWVLGPTGLQNIIRCWYGKKHKSMEVLTVGAP